MKFSQWLQELDPASRLSLIRNPQIVNILCQEFEGKSDPIQSFQIETVRIPPGNFLMGNEGEKKERPEHWVKVPEFWMGQYLITQSQWNFVATCLPKEQYELKPSPSNFKGESLPVENVNWREAVEFCNRLSKHTGKKYRLPTESEWEYACRAGTVTRYHFGDNLITEKANFGKTRNQTTPVGMYPPNAFGLYDMHGNVYEWCLDYWHDSYEGAPTDGSAWLKGGDANNRVIRGGAWDYYPRYCRSAYRSFNRPGDRYYVIGFRICHDLE